jgi:hypothetical protein
LQDRRFRRDEPENGVCQEGVRIRALKGGE